MNVIGIDHVVVAAADLEETTDLWERRLGLTFGDVFDAREYDDEEMREEARSNLSQEGIEVIAPTSDEHPIAGYLETQGPGVFAVMIEVADADAAREELAEQGVEPAHTVRHENDEGHWMVEYIYSPTDFGGVMTGLFEYDAPHPVQKPVLE